jgi:acyl-coenzyme A thioesterase PaaI-like protein
MIPAPTTPPLNEQLLKGNTCFGCGPDNPDGLKIAIYRDGARTDRLIGIYRPRDMAGGFPQIVHGGLQFTALDCMAGWVVFILRSPGKAIPLTKTASTRFHRPARLGAELALSAEVVREASSPRDPFLIHTEIRDGAGALLTEIDFEYVVLPEERFMKAVGIEVMPDSYRRHFGEL